MASEGVVARITQRLVAHRYQVALAAASVMAAIAIGAMWATDYRRNSAETTPTSKRNSLPKGGLLAASHAVAASAFGTAGDPPTSPASGTSEVPPSFASPQSKADLVTLPRTPAEVGELLSAHWAKGAFTSFLPAVDFLYEQELWEMRDEAWAIPLEQRFKREAVAVGGIHISGGDCRAGLCRYAVDLVGPEHRMTALINFSRRFVSSSPDSEGGLALYYRAEDADAYTMYVFTLNPDAPYLAPLAQMLESGSN